MATKLVHHTLDIVNRVAHKAKALDHLSPWHNIYIQGLYLCSQEKDFDTCHQNFLWFGCGSLVHKGLDWVLEAFSQMPDCHLTICGSISQEKKFVEPFSKELSQTLSIHTV